MIVNSSYHYDNFAFIFADLTTLTGELAQVKLIQMEQKDRYELFCQKIGAIEEVIAILVSE